MKGDQGSSSMYSVLETEQKNIRKAKYVKRNMVEDEIRHEEYKEALCEEKQFLHRMNMLRSEGHKIYGTHMNKVLLLSFDTKRWIADDSVYSHWRMGKDTSGISRRKLCVWWCNQQFLTDKAMLGPVPMVYLQQLRPCQRAALVNRLKSFRDFCRRRR